MKLFLVQDPDRPMHVIANSWSHALEKWKDRIAQENTMQPEDVEEPSGIHLIAEDNDIIP